jgi:hypothetical protein
VTHAPIESLVLGTQITFVFIGVLLLISTVFAIGLWWFEQNQLAIKDIS